MSQGEIIDDRAWFGFTLEQLFWLLDKIPVRDSFHDEIKVAINKLDPELLSNHQ